MRIIKLFMSLFQSFFVQLQQRRTRLEHHIAADEILKSWLRWTHWFVSAAAAGWSRRRKEEDGRVFGELRERDDRNEEYFWCEKLSWFIRERYEIYTPALRRDPADTRGQLWALRRKTRSELHNHLHSASGRVHDALTVSEVHKWKDGARWCYRVIKTAGK